MRGLSTALICWLVVTIPVAAGPVSLGEEPVPSPKPSETSPVAAEWVAPALVPEAVVSSTPETGQFLKIQWSPRGDALLMKARSGIYKTDYPPDDGLQKIGFSNLPSPTRVAWSPDGSALVYAIRNGIPDEIRIYDVRQGIHGDPIHRSLAKVSALTWSSSDRIVAQDASVEENQGILVFDGNGVRRPPSEAAGVPFVWLEGKGERRLWDLDPAGIPRPISPPGNWSEPLVSPTGVFIAVWTDADDAAYSSTVVLDGNGGLVRDLGGFFHASEWSEDGESLLGWYEEIETDGHAERTTASDLVLVGAGSWQVRRVVTPDRLESHPSWCGATGKIAYVEGEGDSVVVSPWSVR